MITFLSPVVASFALKFGPPEFFAVYLLTFCAFVGMSGGNAAKTVASMMIGFALAAVGLDSVTGTLRLTFGFTSLLKGFDFLIAVIGLFGIGEILETLEEGWRSRERAPNQHEGRPGDVERIAALLGDFLAQLRGRVLHGDRAGRGDAGVVHELRPGAAPLQGRQGFRQRQGRGRGGAGNGAHAAGTAALLPMITLGVPGSPTAAVLLGAS